MTPKASPVSCAVTTDASIYAARSMLRPLAGAIGFEREVIEELVLVVSELASNILKYGEGGSIELAPIEREDGMKGISMTARDNTPPFDLALGQRDGYDAHGKLDPARVYGRGGIGAGLGCVFRLSDRVDLVPHEGGKSIVVRRWVSRPRRGSNPSF